MKKLVIILALLPGVAGCMGGIGEAYIATQGVVAAVGGAAAIVKAIKVVWKRVGRRQEGTAYYDYHIEVVHRSVLRTLNEMGMPPATNMKDANGQYLMEAGSADEMFQITIIPVQSNVTEVRVRIKRSTSKEYAQLFFKMTQDNIGVLEFSQGKPIR